MEKGRRTRSPGADCWRRGFLSGRFADPGLPVPPGQQAGLQVDAPWLADRYACHDLQPGRRSAHRANCRRCAGQVRADPARPLHPSQPGDLAARPAGRIRIADRSQRQAAAREGALGWAGLAVEGTGTPRDTPRRNALATTHWNSSMLRGPMIGTQDGKPVHPVVSAQPEERIRLASGEQIARRATSRLSGDLDFDNILVRHLRHLGGYALCRRRRVGDHLRAAAGRLVFRRQRWLPAFPLSGPHPRWAPSHLRARKR